MSKPADAYDGKVTDQQVQELEKLRIEFVSAKGTPAEDAARERYQSYATELLIDLSGKLEPGPNQEPDSGFVKPGGWGANANADLWVTAKMKAPADWWKVVDDKGVNVATNFKTQDEAQKYITDHKANPSVCAPGYHKDATTGECVPDQPPIISEERDQFGILKIYKDKPNGSVNTKFVLEEKRRNYASGKPSEDSVEYTAMANSVQQNSDIECTFYTKINSFKKETDSISDKMTGPNHSDGNKSWVIPDFDIFGGTGKTLETENPHPKNKGVNPKPLTKIGDKIVGKYFGHKAITWVDGNTRYVESWIHFPVLDIDQIALEQGEWRQYIPRTKIEDSCREARGKLMTCRIDGVKKGDPPNFKYCSVREIEVPAASPSK